MNHHACRVFAREREDIVGRKMWELEDGMPEETWRLQWERIAAAGAIEFRVDRERPDGSRLVLDVTANYLEGSDLVISYGRDITARVAAEELARVSEAQYQRIVEIANEGIWACDSEFRTTIVNAQMAAMLGHEPDEMIGRRDLEFVHPDDEGLLRREGEARRLGRPSKYECRFVAKDGTTVWLHASSVADMGPDGEFQGTFALYTDITERKRAEEELKAERTNLAAIFEASPVAMLVFDQAANVVRVNRASLRLAARDAEDLLVHRPDSSVQCGDVLGCVNHRQAEHGCGNSPECPLCPLRDAVQAALDGRVSLRGVELTLDVVREGEPAVAWLRIGAEPMVMNDAPHVTVAVDDITDRRRAERALAESEERFRSLAERVPGFVSIKDSEHRYVYLNSLLGARIDGGKEAWLGKRPEEVWEPDEAVVSNAAADRALAGEKVDEVVKLRRGGQTRYFHALHFPIVRDGEAPLEGGLMIDVSDRVEAEEEVRRQAAQLRRTVEGAVLAMSQVVETRDPYTAGHERRVAELATVMGRELGMDGAELDGLRLGSLIARHRQDRGAGGDPRQARPAEPGRVQPHQAALSVGVRHPVGHRFRAAGRGDGPAAPRATGRLRLSARPGGRRPAAGDAHPRRSGRRRSDVVASAVPSGARHRRGAVRDPRRRRGQV